MKIVLTIAGSDSCGGAGIQADLKTFSALGTYGMSVITAITAQNTMGVTGVREMDLEIIKGQIDCLYEDIRIDAVKIGMVSSEGIIRTIAEGLRRHQARNVVVDPVMVSKSGCHLLRPEAREGLTRLLFPLADVVTPNLLEAELLTGKKIETISGMERAARDIYRFGPGNVLVKGGHLTGEAVDVLYDGREYHYLKGQRLDSRNTHGTGCTLSSAIAAGLARGLPVVAAVRQAKEYINGAIAHALELGHGVGPVNHFYELYRKAGVNNGS